MCRPVHGRPRPTQIEIYQQFREAHGFRHDRAYDRLLMGPHIRVRVITRTLTSAGCAARR